MKRKTLPSFNHQLTFGSARPRRRGRGLIFLMFLLIVGGASYPVIKELPGIARYVPFAPQPASELPPDWQAPAVAFVSEPEPPPVRKVDVEYVVRPNDTLGQIFERLGLGAGDLPGILTAPGVADSLRVLRPGDRLTFELHNDVLHALTRRISDTRVLAITRDGGGFVAHTVETPIELRTVQVRGSINSARFFGGRAVGVPPDMAAQLTDEIFGWDIDFALDVRPGDRFKIVYEQKFRHREYLGDGRIVAAEFVNDGKVYRAVRYSSPDGAIDGYFNPEGRSVRRPFLRTPIDFTRVRPTPEHDGHETALHVLPGHRGLDYAAPIGTAVKAAGDGRVRFSGAYGDFGNTIIIDHGDSISTVYAHLSGFAPQLQANRQVTQGEVIGYVGFTGVATAPHLHYEYRVDGKATDPRTVALPPGPPLPEAYRADFEAKLAALLATLEQGADAAVMAVRTD